MKKFEEKTTDTQKIFDGRIISLQVDNVTLPNGKTSKREIVKHPGAVAVIGMTEENKILFVKQYRKPLERSLVEIPAGRIEPNEDPKITAIRELEEETGYTTKAVTHITSFYTSPGFADEIIHIYYSDQLTRLTEEVQGDEDEFVEVFELTLEEAKQMMKDKAIYDAKTVYALSYLSQLNDKDE